MTVAFLTGSPMKMWRGIGRFELKTYNRGAALNGRPFCFAWMIDDPNGP